MGMKHILRALDQALETAEIERFQPFFSSIYAYRSEGGMGQKSKERREKCCPVR